MAVPFVTPSVPLASTRDWNTPAAKALASHDVPEPVTTALPLVTLTVPVVYELPPLEPMVTVSLYVPGATKILSPAAVASAIACVIVSLRAAQEVPALPLLPPGPTK